MLCSGVHLCAEIAKKPDFKRFSGIEKCHRNSIKITVAFWRRARDFFGALPCAFASLRSLTTSAKTVHRTVFFRRLRLLPPCSNPFIYFCQCKKQALRPAFRFGGEQGIRTLEQALTCYTISNRAPSASSDNSPNVLLDVLYIIKIKIASKNIICYNKNIFGR